jgi:hypothetical protein
MAGQLLVSTGVFGLCERAWAIQLLIPMRLVEGVNHSHNFVAHGTSVGMAIQEVAYNAMTHLHNEIPVGAESSSDTN